MSADDFDAKGKTNEMANPIGKYIINFAFAHAEEFIDEGHSAHQATSIMAGILLRAAWIVAGSGALADGAIPNKERFRRRVEEILEHVAFKDNEDQTEEAAE